jgi:hypothetical protein
MDLIRDILIITADSDGPVDTDVFVTDSHDGPHVGYHVTIMRDAGIIDVEARDYKSGAKRSVLGLTWAGQDYLAAIEDSTVWKKTKDTIVNVVGSATLAVIKSTAEGVATAAISKSIGR